MWHVVKVFAAQIGNERIAPHDLGRTCARLRRAAGGELEQIQYLLGPVSVQATERYLGCTQRIAIAVNDKIGIEGRQCELVHLWKGCRPSGAIRKTCGCERSSLLASAVARGARQPL